MQMRQRGDKGRNCDLRGAVENRLLHLLALGEVAFDVLDFDRGVIDQDADGQRQTRRGS